MSNFATSDCFGLTITASVFKPPLQPQKPLISPPSYTPSSLQCPSPPPPHPQKPLVSPHFHTPLSLHCPCPRSPPPPPSPTPGPATFSIHPPSRPPHTRTFLVCLLTTTPSPPSLPLPARPSCNSCYCFMSTLQCTSWLDA